MQADTVAMVRIAPTKAGAVGVYIEDVPSGEVIFRTLVSRSEWDAISRGETVGVACAVTPCFERVGYAVEVRRYEVPASIIASAKRHHVELAEASLIWFARQPECDDDLDEIEARYVDGEWEVMTRSWPGAYPEPEDAEGT